MRGEPGIVELIDRAQWIGVPSIALGELHSGFLAGRHTERNEEELERFLRHPVVEELAVDYDVARIYAEIVLSLIGCAVEPSRRGVASRSIGHDPDAM